MAPYLAPVADLPLGPEGLCESDAAVAFLWVVGLKNIRGTLKTYICVSLLDLHDCLAVGCCGGCGSILCRRHLGFDGNAVPLALLLLWWHWLRALADRHCRLVGLLALEVSTLLVACTHPLVLACLVLALLAPVVVVFVARWAPFVHWAILVTEPGVV